MVKSKFKSANENGNLCDPAEAIFPILKQLDKNQWQLIGTAFYITTNGIFLTARHVLDDVINQNIQTHPIAAFHFLPNKQYMIRPILRAFLKNHSDVAAGLVAEAKHNLTGDLLNNKVVILSRSIAKDGTLIHTYAYPKTECTLKKIVFSPNYYEGKITSYFPNGRDSVLMPHRCYQTTMNILGGASGGPVFNCNGEVIGINSTGFEQNTNSHISFISDINEIFNITIDKINIPPDHDKQYTIEQLAKLGFVSTR